MLALVVVLSFIAKSSHADGDVHDHPKGLMVVPKGPYSPEELVTRFVTDNMEPRHAVAVVVVGKGSKRHKLVEDLAENDDDLRYFVAMGIQFGKGSSLVMYRYKYPKLTYEGKWTRSAIRAWLQDTAFPPVNMMERQFSPPKYFTHAPYGTVLIVKELTEQSKELVKALEPYAEMFQNKLKFTFFTKSIGTQKLCDMFGVWTNDELLVLEQPHDLRPRTHTNVPGSAKFRLEGVTPASIERFFHEYAAGTWPRYYKSAFPRGEAVVVNGIRELSGWDFLEVVNDPNQAVLVEFVSKNCASCDEFAPTFQGLGRKVLEARKRDSTAFANLTLARIDQSAHEHAEIVRGTPWLRFWPQTNRRKSSDVEARSIDGLVEFLEDNMAQDTLEPPADRKRPGKASANVAAPAQATEQKAVTTHPEASGIQLSHPDPETARSYLRTDEEPTDVPEVATLRFQKPASEVDEDEFVAASRGYLTTEPSDPPQTEPSGSKEEL